ncbi:Uncharacterized protein HZ326_11617 [Fusarium oxysporum f. sp. albedinis]|nr:Uncharacterized protein HZ326_11617 [Fusarium oxysporum f. sp. albedinis]
MTIHPFLTITKNHRGLIVSDSINATNMQLIFGTITLHKLKHRALQNEYEQGPVIKAHSDVRRYWRAFYSSLLAGCFVLCPAVMLTAHTMRSTVMRYRYAWGGFCAGP